MNLFKKCVSFFMLCISVQSTILGMDPRSIMRKEDLPIIPSPLAVLRDEDRALAWEILTSPEIMALERKTKRADLKESAQAIRHQDVIPQIRMLKTLLQRDTAPGTTVLHRAAEEESFEIMYTALECGTSVHVVNEEGLSPLDIIIIKSVRGARAKPTYMPHYASLLHLLTDAGATFPQGECPICFEDEDLIPGLCRTPKCSNRIGLKCLQKMKAAASQEIIPGITYQQKITCPFCRAEY